MWTSVLLSPLHVSPCQKKKERKKQNPRLQHPANWVLVPKCRRESLDTKQAGEGCSGKGDLPTSRPGRSWEEEEEGGRRGFVLVFISSNEMCSMNTDQGCVSPSRSKGTKHCCDKAQHTTDLLFLWTILCGESGEDDDWDESQPRPQLIRLAEPLRWQ